MKTEPILNPRKRRVARSQIPQIEVISSLLVILGLIGVISWLLLQKNSYDPAFRDLPEAYIGTGTVDVQLHKPEIQPASRATSEGTDTTPVLGYLPSAILNENWQLSSPLREFDGATLFEKINGEADKFLQHGFKKLQFIRLANEEASLEIGIELYDQGNLAGSLGVFAEYLSTASGVSTHESVVYILNQAGGIGRNGRFFVRIIGNRESQRIVDKTESILKSLSALPLKAEDVPFEYRLLTEGLGIDPAQIAFQSNNVFQFNFAEDFWFGTPIKDQNGRVFVHRADSDQQARELFEQLVENQRYDYEIIRKTETLAILQHLYLKTWFVLKLEGSVLLGAEKMKEMSLAERLIRQASNLLMENLGND